MSWLPYITMFLLMMVGLMLIFIILLQRGRGGGLAGALGGMGGQSAFGTKAGDVFTKITIGLATVWMLLAAGNVFALRFSDKKYTGGSEAVSSAGALESTDDKDKKLSDDEMKDLMDKVHQVGGEKAADKADDKKPADPVKAPESTEFEKPADDKKPAEEKKPEERPAAPEEAPKSEKPAEPEAKEEKKPE